MNLFDDPLSEHERWEINRLIATQIMGWTEVHEESHDVTRFFGKPAEHTAPKWLGTWDGVGFVAVPDYAANMSAAQQVVEEMAVRDQSRPLNLLLMCYAYKRTYACFTTGAYDWGDGIVSEGNGEYATPTAICRAALAALGVAAQAGG
jgi:hypothetical protein